MALCRVARALGACLCVCVCVCVLALVLNQKHQCRVFCVSTRLPGVRLDTVLLATTHCLQHRRVFGAMSCAALLELAATQDSAAGSSKCRRVQPACVCMRVCTGSQSFVGTADSKRTWHKWAGWQAV
ncbi:hypothetical protein COO60DRAFT_577364 [Scenedesmus sp. NREL 46B-D3]|nr:hypothetical protein COO60DRAFT_577364 [Scenedesmus sp. NREL 46B-D3]